MIIRTGRLNIFPLSDQEMKKIISTESDAALKAAYAEMLDGCLKNPEQRIWYALWLLELNDGSGSIVGSLSFKGLDKSGVAEIGYGMKPEFEGKGLMTEAVSAVVDWALEQPGVMAVEAETEPDNIASRRVLEKAGFVPTGTIGKEGPRYVRKKSGTNST